MRRRLFLLRHAKSSWDDPGLDDHDRPLSPRGEKAIRRVRAHLKEGGHLPTVVLCSSSRRTLSTLDGIRDALPARATVTVREDLYLADAGHLLDVVRALPDEATSAMVIAHNPGMEDLAAMLVGSGDGHLRRALEEKYPTGALATLSFTGPWALLGPHDARLDDLFLPRPPRPPHGEDDTAAPAGDS